MRRVNEAMREVLSGAITSELKDPRVGFVTVTAVETSPDLRHARVFVSVLGNPGERRRTLQALDNAHGFLQRRVGGELRMKNTPQLAVRLRRHARARDADHASCSTEPPAGRRVLMGGSNGALSSREEVLRAIRDARALLPDHARAPGRRRRRLAGRDAAGAGRARQGRGGVHARRRVPAARTSTASSSSRASRPSRPPTSAERTLIFLDCGNIDRTPADALKRERRRRADPQHRPPPRQHALRDDQPRRPARVVHGGDGVGPDARARRAGHAGDRRGALRRPGDRHRAASCTRTPARGRTRWRPS